MSKKDAFGVFIDLQKAFDFVDRDVLLYKLLSNGIDGKIYNSIKSILSDTSSCIKLNGMSTDWFPYWQECDRGIVVRLQYLLSL